jgi:hypothetical protein
VWTNATEHARCHTSVILTNKEPLVIAVQTIYQGLCGAPEGIRTPNLLIRSQMLYPLSYGRMIFSCRPPARYPVRRAGAEAPGFEPGMGGYPKPH